MGRGDGECESSRSFTGRLVFLAKIGEVTQVPSGLDDVNTGLREIVKAIEQDTLFDFGPPSKI